MSGSMRAHLDRVAEALYLADTSMGARKFGWWEIARDHRMRYRAMAQAAIEAHTKALGLEQQWGAFYDDGTLVDDVADDRDHAQEIAAERCQSCDSCRGAQPKHVQTRLVSPWRADGED